MLLYAALSLSESVKSVSKLTQALEYLFENALYATLLQCLIPFSHVSTSQ